MPVALEEMQAPDTIPFLSLQLNKSMRNYGIDLVLRFLRVAYHVYTRPLTCGVIVFNNFFS